MTVPWSTLAVEAVVVVLVPVAAVAVQVRRACARTVQEVITDRGITGSDARRLPALGLSRPTVLALRNAVRNPVRLGLTVLTITACGAVLVGVLSTGRALGHLTDQVGGYWAYDVELGLNRSVPLDEARAVVAENPAVAGVEGWILSQGFRIRPDGTENENVSITAVPIGSASIEPTLVEGRWFDGADDRPVVVNSHLVDEEPDLAVGGPLTLDIEGRRGVWTVVGVATTTLVGPVAYLPVDVLADELGRSGEANLLAVELIPGSDQSEVASRLESDARNAGLPVGSVLTNAEHRSYVDGLFALVVAFLLIIGVVLALVAMIGVAGSMTLSVVEQTREIGVVRTLGASGWAVRWLFLVQGLGIASVGCALGVVASLPVALALRSALGRSLIGASLPYGFSWLGVGLWVVIALAIGAAGATRPARTAARLTVRDTLAYE
jgi:putative ABC transport system permease protein